MVEGPNLPDAVDTRIKSCSPGTLPVIGIRQIKDAESKGKKMVFCDAQAMRDNVPQLPLKAISEKFFEVLLL